VKGTKRKKREAPGCYLVNYEALKKLCEKQGKWIGDVLDEIDLSRHTKEKIERNEPIRPSSVKQLAEVVGAEHMNEIVRRVEDAEIPSQSHEGSTVGKPIDEWVEEKVLTKWITTVNGLQYRILKMRHQDMKDSFARAKCYDLSDLADDERTRIKHLLVRHPTVCRTVSVSPRVMVNERSVQDPTGKYYWVIDRWVDGPYLSDVLDKETLSPVEALRIAREIAEGLKHLHDHSIIRRELSPRFVLLRNPDRSVVLTDFELAKLLDTGPTVSKDWPQDPYRAPEVGDGKIDARADIYSWGRIVIHMAVGTLPPIGQERKTLRGSDLPEELIGLLTRCVALPPSDRPNSMTDVIKVLDSLS
jgi:serine/threonine protein kinase